MKIKCFQSLVAQINADKVYRQWLLQKDSLEKLLKERLIVKIL